MNFERLTCETSAGTVSTNRPFLIAPAQGRAGEAGSGAVALPRRCGGGRAMMQFTPAAVHGSDAGVGEVGLWILEALVGGVAREI